MGEMNEWADFFYTILFLLFSHFLVSISNNLVISFHLWKLKEIMPCSFSHPLSQCFLMSQVNLIPEGQSLPPTQGLRPTLGEGSPFCMQPPPHCWVRAGWLPIVIPEERWLPPSAQQVSLHMVRAMGQKGSLWLFRCQDEENQHQGPKDGTAGDKRLLHINNRSLQKQWAVAQEWEMRSLDSRWQIFFR